MDELLLKVKANLIIDNNIDDTLLLHYISAAVAYAESYQHVPKGYYFDNSMPPTTEQMYGGVHLPHSATACPCRNRPYMSWQQGLWGLRSSARMSSVSRSSTSASWTEAD